MYYPYKTEKISVLLELRYQEFRHISLHSATGLQAE